MRVGMVCPYSFDVPGGVQWHVRDLAEYLLGQGHEVSVLAPADDDTPLEPYVVSAGRAVPVRYNGSVARLNFGPVTAARVSRWVEAGRFDLLHIHEPITPSISLLALWAAETPVVATFHTASERSRWMQAARPVVGASLDKIVGRIAVSREAQRTLREGMHADAVVIPNGVYTERFAAAAPRAEWCGTPDAPTLGFLGRLDEPRKGLGVLLAALPAVLAARPGTRLLVVGPGDAEVLGPDLSHLSFPVQDADVLAARLRALLADPAARRFASETGRRVAAQYDWSTVATRIVEVYELARLSWDSMAGAFDVDSGRVPRVPGERRRDRAATWIRRAGGVE